MGDGKQGDACILGCLEDLAFHVNAHGARTFIQEGILGPWGWGPSGQDCGPSFAEPLACFPDSFWPNPCWALRQGQAS